MSTWNKIPVSKSQIQELTSRYDIDALSASILIRRNITDGRDLLYYFEDDLRFQHSPFSFNAMEDAVDRITAAKENGEKVLIFGDRDVDGISSTTIMYDSLHSMGIDVSYRLPIGDDAYGLSMQAVDDFYKENGSLIITVDCGISNYDEIAYAYSLGLDVIVIDHHNPPKEIPQKAVLIDPKIEDSGYPFSDISGAAVAYKVVSALRFSKSEWYKTELTLLNLTYKDDGYEIECIKTRNLIPVSRLTETIREKTSINRTKLSSYLKGQIIAVWDAQECRKNLTEVFGSAVDFNLFDLKEEIAKVFPKLANLSLSQLKSMSKIAKYGNHPPTEIGGFYNIYVTYIRHLFRSENPQSVKEEERDLQLVALAALSDIMPMKDENRIFVKKGLDYINSGKTRQGLRELMSRLNLLGKRVNSTDLSWVVVSHLNATGRLGHPELAAELFLTSSADRRDEVASQIIDLNTQRKQLTSDALNYSSIQASVSIPNYNNNLCLVIDERVNRGVCGLLAGKLVTSYNVPAIVVTFVDDIAIGSVRSCRGYNATSFLNQLDDLFINHGGHNAAAGFSLKRERIKEFEERVKQISATIELEDSKADIFEVDAEIPESYLSPKLLDLEDLFEPYGEQNRQLLLMSKNLSIADAVILGKSEKMHLKLTLKAGNYKWPALFWNEGQRLNRDFEIGDKVDILYHVERNTFNGVETPQLMLTDIKKSI